MRDLLGFVFRFRITFLFLTLQVFAFYLLFSSNNYHKAQWFSATNDVVGTIFEFRQNIASYTQLNEQNRLLAKENEQWRNLHKSAYSTVESKYVRIQDTIFQQQYRHLAAKVVNNTTGRENNYLTINKGAHDGVKVDMGVVGPLGIVGKIVEVSENYSTAMSVLHRKFTATVKSTKSGHKGFLKWDTGNSRSASVIDVARHAPVQEGDAFVTRGYGGTFPEGAMVGTVTKMADHEGSSYHNIEIMLSTDFNAVSHVYIVMDLTKEERQELEQETEEAHAADGNQ